MLARKLMAVKNNYVVIRMDVAGETQWGASCEMERVCGRGGIRKICGKVLDRRKSIGEESKAPHVKSTGGAPRFVFEFIVRATRLKTCRPFSKTVQM